MGTVLLMGAGKYGIPEFTPLALGNLFGWYKSDIGITLNGADVSQWGDQSGQGNNLIQNTASLQPLYVGDLGNGYPALLYNDTDVLALPVDITGLTEFTMFAVITIAGSNSQIGLGDGYNRFYTYYGGVVHIGTLAIGNYAIGAGVPVLMQTKGDTNGCAAYANGALIGNGAASLYTVFHSIATMNGHIQECLIYNVKKSDTDIALVNDYLNQKYAIF